MVDGTKKQDREQEQATRQTRIKAAVAGFFEHGMKQVQAKHARHGARPETLFVKQEYDSHGR